MVLKYYSEECAAPAVEKVPYTDFISADLGRGKDFDEHRDVWHSQFLEYWRNRRDIVERVGLDDAEVVVAPFDWIWARGGHWRPNPRRDVAEAVTTHTRALHRIAQSRGLPFILLFSGDRSHEDAPFADAFVLREAMYASRRGPQDFCMPGFSEDLAMQIDAGLPGAREDGIVLREKSEVPTVGFCGLVPSPKLGDLAADAVFLAEMARRFRRVEPTPHYGERLRRKALHVLGASRDVDHNFIIREESVFFGRGPHDRVQMRAEYIQNMVDSDYVLCCRGSGNYSFRLYETLSMGRIPIIIDTDNVYPCAESIDWTDLGVFCRARDIPDLPALVRQHYDRHGDAEFKALQVRNRRIWRDRITPYGFFATFAETFAALTRTPTT